MHTLSNPFDTLYTTKIYAAYNISCNNPYELLYITRNYYFHRMHRDEIGHPGAEVSETIIFISTYKFIYSYKLIRQ